MVNGRDDQRGRILIEESREAIVVLDSAERIVLASRRAREMYPEAAPGQAIPAAAATRREAAVVLEIPYEIDGETERLVYLSRPGDLRAYEELRAGFTAAVSHELRTPLARLLALFESAELPGSDIPSLVDRARREVGQMGELIDDVLFLGELETGHAVVGLGPTAVIPIVREVADELQERAERAGVHIHVSGEDDAHVGVRPRMLRVLVINLIENAIRYAGTDCRLDLTVERDGQWIIFTAADTGRGVPPDAIARLFERFYRADAARASRGTGLGLAICKHIVTSAGGDVFATSGPGQGLTVRCEFPEVVADRL